MHNILRSVVAITLIVISVLLHISVLYILPPPWNNVNVLFVFAVLILFGWSSRMALWVTFFFSFLLELLSATSFGIGLTSATLSILFLSFIFERFFTTRSWYSVTVLAFVAIIVYRFLFTVLFLTVDQIQDTGRIAWQALYIPYLWELGTTTLIVALVAFTLSRITSRFHRDSTVLTL